MIAGPLLGGVVAGALGVRETFLALALLLAGAGRVGAVRAGRARPPRSASRASVPALRAAGSERMIAISLIVIMLVALVGGTLQVLMPLHLGDARRLASRRWAGCTRCGAVLGSVAIATTGRLGDRIGRLPIARVDCLVLGGAVAVLLLPLEHRSPSRPCWWRSCRSMSVLYGVGYPLGADGADRAGLGHGLVLGLVNLVWGAGAMVGPVLGAAVASRAGDRAAYALLVVLCSGRDGAHARAVTAPARAASVERPARPRGRCRTAR